MVTTQPSQDRSGGLRVNRSEPILQPPAAIGSQTRTCVRCGRHTRFVLDDPAGGWYVCTGCGRYA